MTSRASLIGSVAIGALLTFAMTGAASAKPVHHRRHTVAKAPSETLELKSEVETLKAQVQALEGRLDSQAQAQQQTAAQVQTAQAQAQTASTQAQAATAQAQAAQTQIATIPDQVKTLAAAEPHVAYSSQHRFSLSSPDGQYTIGLVGRLQFDTGDYVSFSPQNPLAGPQQLSNGIDARRARIGVAGTAAGGWAYSFIYDAGNSSDATAKGIQTAQISYKGFSGASIDLGYSDTYFTLDEATTSTDLLFLERASPSNIATSLNAGDFRSNAGVRFFGDRYWIGGYVTGPASGDSHTTTGERLGAFGRVAVQAFKGDDYSLHIGVGFDELLRAPNSGGNSANAITLSDQPELRIDPTTFLNTGTIGSATNPVTSGYVANVETAATWRGLFWQGEYYHYEISRLGLPHNSFDGGYGQVSWTLTGETHPYIPSSAAYGRISPKNPFSLKEGTWGAWELAGRFSYVDLNSRFTAGNLLSADPSSIDGGLQRGYTVGINWYPNDLLRFMLDYNHEDYRKAEGGVVSGIPLGSRIGATLDAISLRAQFVY